MKKLILILILTLSLLPKQSFAKELTDEDITRAVIGEASNQGYDGMLAVACAIKNRGTLKGVYGFKSALPDREPRWVWDLAKKAVKNAKLGDVTNGATHWENTTAFGVPYWSKSMIQTYKIKDHTFYKEKKRG